MRFLLLFVVIQSVFSFLFWTGRWEKAIRYTFQFGTSITNPESRLNTYFFKRFYLEELPRGAYLVGLGPDFWQIYLNGKKLGDFRAPGRAISAVLDLTQNLKIGENFIAVAVKRRSLGKPWFRAEIHLHYPHTRKIFSTDRSWWTLSALPSETISSWFSFSPSRKYAHASTYFGSPEKTELPFPPEAFIPLSYAFTSSSDHLKLKVYFTSFPGEKLFLVLATTGFTQLTINDSYRLFSPDPSLRKTILDLSGLLSPLSKNEVCIQASGYLTPPTISLKIINSRGKEIPIQIEGNYTVRQTIVEPQKKEIYPTTWLSMVLHKKLFLVLFLFWSSCGILIWKFLPKERILIEYSLIFLFIYLLDHQFLWFKTGKDFFIFQIIFLPIYFIGRYWISYFLGKIGSLWQAKFYSIDFAAYFLIAIGIALRLYFLDKTALSTDEITLISYAGGILERGYPSKFLGSILNSLCTYEFSAYILAFFMGLGFNGLSLRFSALLASLGVMFLLWKEGKKLFSPETAFLALLFYVFSPLALHFGSYVFHVQYDQFLFLLSGFLFIRYWLGPGLPSPKQSFFWSLVCSLLYLSWEGSIFALGTFFILIFCFKGFSIIKEKPFWISVLVIFLTVFLQFFWRTIHSYPHLLHGLTPFFFTPTLAFLDQQFDPLFIIKHYLLSYGYAVFFLSACFTILFSRQKLDLAIFLLFFLPALGIYLFLLHPLSHYFYFLFPFLCLSSARGLQLISKKLSISGTILYVCIFILSSPWPLKIYIGFLPEELFYHRRPEMIWVEYRELHRHLKRISSNELVLIHTAPHILPENLKLKKLYFLKLTPLITTFYNPIEKKGAYYDKFQGSVSINSFEQLKKISGKEKNICIYIFNQDRFEDYAKEKLKKFIKSFFEPVCEDGNAILYCRTIISYN